MPSDHILELLIAERDKLNRAIDALQGPTRRMVRPPKTQSANAASASAKNGRVWTAAAREEQAERMRARWRKARAKKMNAQWAKRKRQTGK